MQPTPMFNMWYVLDRQMPGPNASQEGRLMTAETGLEDANQKNAPILHALRAPGLQL